MRGVPADSGREICSTIPVSTRILRGGEKTADAGRLDAKSLNPAALATLPLWARQRGLARTAEEIGVGEPTLADILTELAKRA